MTKEGFEEILKEYGFTDAQIDLLWDTKPSDDLDETQLRKSANNIAPIKEKLTWGGESRTVKAFILSTTAHWADLDAVFLDKSVEHLALFLKAEITNRDYFDHRGHGVLIRIRKQDAEQSSLHEIRRSVGGTNTRNGYLEFTLYRVPLYMPSE